MTKGLGVLNDSCKSTRTLWNNGTSNRYTMDAFTSVPHFGPDQKQTDIVAFFLCWFSYFSDRTVWSGPNQLMSQWNEPKHNNKTHMRTLASVVGQMCLRIFCISQTALWLDRNNMREDVKFQQNFSQTIHIVQKRAVLPAVESGQRRITVSPQANVSVCQGHLFREV